jgi:hypothetical protein
MAETRNFSTRLTLFAESSEAALQWTRGALAAVRVLRLPLVISLVASAVLLLPLQTLELYRVLAQDVVSRSKSEPHWYDLMFAAAGTPEMVFGIAGLLILTFCIWYMTHRLTGLLGHLVPKSSQTGTTLLLVGPAVLSVLPLFAVATALHTAGHYDDIDQAGPITVLQNLADQKQAELVSELLNSFDRLKDLLAAGAIISAALGFCILLLALRLAYRRRGSHASPGISVLEVLVCWSFFAATITAVILFPVALPQTMGALAITGLFFGALALVSGQLNVLA